jgi:hypothetical protein
MQIKSSRPARVNSAASDMFAVANSPGMSSIQRLILLDFTVTETQV